MTVSVEVAIGKMAVCVYMLRNCMKISEFIEELEKIKEEHGDLPVKTLEYDSLYEECYVDEANYPEYYKEDEECVVIGQ